MEFYDEMKPLVERAARNARSNFPDYIKLDDVEQATWVAAYENQASLTKAMEKEGGEGLAMYILLRNAREFALAEDAAINGYDTEDIYMYSEEVVKSLLESAFEYDDWQSFSTFGDSQPRSKKDPSMSGDFVAMLVDVKAAAEKLSEDSYNALVWYYKYHYTYAMLADTLDISEEAARKRVKRAVGAVRRNLGRRDLSDLQHGYKRHVARPSTGASARFLVENDYEG
jgi:sigma-70-like protein